MILTSTPLVDIRFPCVLMYCFLKCSRNSEIIVFEECTMTALERGKKIDELQKRLLDSEMLRNRCTRKVTLLKDQVRTTSETAEQERSMCENSIQLLRDDLTNTKASLADCHRRENQVFL
ncbi:uncharacterized protein LOC142321271 [Lycorma delicatula]|uniref:uncharacterized protein LOC142321271 n=1 Tax=Lycorma delicatula TaxID=130591 RepID=UPI003F518DC4